MMVSGRASLFAGIFFAIAADLAMVDPAGARPRPPASRSLPSPAARATPSDASGKRTPPDLLLKAEGQRKAQALAEFVRGAEWEENGEIEKALQAYRKVLDVDPGQADLASRVAILLARADDYPAAIDVLKDAIKANPHAAQPYLQLSFISARYLNRTDQAIEYANRAIALEPANISAYQRLFEIYAGAGDEDKARQALDRAARVKTDDANFWTQLGKLSASLVFKDGVTPKPAEVARVNAFFKRAAENANEDPAILKDIADYYASSQQLPEAIPLYLRVLELQPGDSNAQERLANGFVLTNQRDKAITLLQAIIKEHPEKYQPYDLLAQVYDEKARALLRESNKEEAAGAFAEAAKNYEQSLLINPSHANTYVRLADLLIGPLKNPERAVNVLTDARRRYPSAPQLTYYLALAQREAKHLQQAVATFEEALHEAEIDGSEMANARFYVDYGATAEQAGLYEKAADLFREAISLDPGNAADAYNYLGYMWAEQNSHLEEAEDAVKHALELDPNNGAYIDSLAWVKYRQGKFDDALTTLQRAIQNLKRDDPVVFDHLGDINAQLNRVPQAVEAWQRALALDPQNKTVAEKIEGAKTKMSKSRSPNRNPFH